MIRLALIYFALSLPLHAGEVLESRVDSKGGHFLLHVDMLIHAEPRKVYALLTDYPNLDRLSPTIRKSEVLYHNPPQARVRVTTEGCIGVFCRKVVQVQDVIERRTGVADQGYILVRVMPEMSDLEYSQNLWHIRPANAGYTRVTYSSDMVPDFWVPPLIGTMLFREFLLEETHAMIDTLEQLANLPDDDFQQ